MGRTLMRRGDLEKAAEALDHAVALHLQSLWGHFYRGQCALRRNRYVDAVDAFGACIALAPESVCYYNRSLAFAGLGATDHARRDFERARQLDPKVAAWPPRPHAAREKRGTANKAARNHLMRGNGSSRFWKNGGELFLESANATTVPEVK